MRMRQVDRDAPLQFLRTAYEPDDWIAVFLKSYETGHTAQRVGPVSLVADARFQAWLRWRNLIRSNIYVSVNAIRPGRRSRTRESVRAIRHVFLEADHDGSQVLAAIDLRRDLPGLSYVLHSSPNRVHVFWRVAGFTIEQAEALQKQLARELGTDVAATPCTQTTRVPGFFNHKPQYVPPHLVTIEYRDSTRVYTPDDFPIPIAPMMATVPVRLSRGLNVRFNRMDRARRYLAALPAAFAGQPASTFAPWTAPEWADSEFFVYDYCVHWPAPRAHIPGSRTASTLSEPVRLKPASSSMSSFTR